MNESDFKITFITVCYKTPDLIRNLLKGIEAAEFAFSFEYIVVDNYPGDGTGEMLRLRFPWVHVIDAPYNVGFGCGNNLALRVARGEYVMLINPDLTIFRGELEKLLVFADEHPDIGILGPQLLNPTRTVQRTFYRFPSALIPLYRRTPLGRLACGQRAVEKYFMQAADPQSSFDVDGLFGAALLIRSSALHSIGLFDERFFMYFEDVDLCRRAWECGWRVCYAPVARFIHYHQRESDVRRWWQMLLNPISRAHIASAVKYFWKYRGKPTPRILS